MRQILVNRSATERVGYDRIILSFRSFYAWCTANGPSDVADIEECAYVETTNDFAALAFTAVALKEYSVT